MEASSFEKLNEQQRAAATFGDGPLLIIAGAGTGKTNTLAHRVAHLISTGINPGRILLLTFTRRAAAEMLKRVETILRAVAATDASRSMHRAGRGDAGVAATKVWGGTFHAMANRLLRLHSKSLGLGDAFTVLDRSDSEDLMNDVRSDLQLDRADARFPRKATCL